MKKLLIVVDYQNDFVDGALGFPGAADIFPAIREKVLNYMHEGQAVVYTKDTHQPEYLDTQEGQNLPVIHCVKGTKGHEFYGDLEVLSEGSKVFEKRTFGSDLLFDYLRSETFDSIELVGLVSNICVLSNAVLAKAALPEALITVDAHCTASHDAGLHEKTLDVLEGIQVQVTHR